MSTPSIQTRLQAALALQRAGQFAQAIDDYLDILSQHPDQHDAHHQLGVAYWNHGQQEVALTHLQRALQAPQVPGGYWLAVVDALTGLGRHSEAQHWLVKARQRGLPASELLGRAHATNPPPEVQEQMFGHMQREELDACRALTHPLLAQYPGFGHGCKMLAYLFQLNAEYRPAL